MEELREYNLASMLLEQGFREYKDETTQLFDLAEQARDCKPRDALISITAGQDKIYIMTEYSHVNKD